MLYRSDLPKESKRQTECRVNYEACADEATLRIAVGRLLEAYDIGVVRGGKLTASYDVAAKHVKLKGKDCRIERVARNKSGIADIVMTGSDEHGADLKGICTYRVEF